jgi:hypothetical protein
MNDKNSHKGIEKKREENKKSYIHMKKDIGNNNYLYPC